MSKIKNMPGIAWLIIGVCVTALVMPSIAYASGALQFKGIEGTSTNKADVTPSGQLLTSNEAIADNLTGTPPYVWFGSGVSDNVNLSTSASCVNFEPLNLPSTENFVLTEVQLNVTTDSTPGAGNDVQVFTDQNCSGTPVSFDTPSTIGLTVVPIDPAITTIGPDGNIKGGNGDYLSAEVDGNIKATVIANGYVAIN
jgi:hypothetical protein